MGVLRREDHILVTSPNDRKMEVIRHRDHVDAEVDVELPSTVILRQTFGCRHVMLRPRRARNVRVNNNVRREDDGENATLHVSVGTLEPTRHDLYRVNSGQEGGTMMTARGG